MLELSKVVELSNEINWKIHKMNYTPLKQEIIQAILV